MSVKITIIALAVIAVAGGIGLFLSLAPINYPDESMVLPVNKDIFSNESKSFSLEGSQNLKKFSSSDEIRKFLVESETLNNVQNTGSVTLDKSTFPTPGGFVPAEQLQLAQSSMREGNFYGAGVPLTLGDPDSNTNRGSDIYSTTNVQVGNVDEPDFLKNDSKYTYIVSGDKLTIIDVYPAETAKILLKIGLDIPQGQNLQNMFLKGDRLIIFYQTYENASTIPEYNFVPRQIYSPKTHALVIDISDKENPKIVKDYSVNGDYNNARMLGDFVYFITINNANSNELIIPQVSESSKTIIAPDVFYFDNPEQYYTFNTITSFNIFGDTINSETFMMSGANTIYVSEKNIYITYQKNIPYQYYPTLNKDRFFEAIVPILPEDIQKEITSITENNSLDSHEKWNKVSELLQDTYNKLPKNEKGNLFSRIQQSLVEYDSKIQQEAQKTIVHKIAINDGALAYVSKGEVPGHLLNQFSMDEFGNRFRVATTSEFYTYQGNHLFNNVYVLDENLKVVGSVEKIAKDESIYSTRFIGDRLYMVTFQRMDPFFVIDLSKDTPQVLGALKIPGFSNYLHPYDENHIIGIGKETKENPYGGIEVQGVKIALFDVSDVANPVIVGVTTIGKQGTESEVLSDHKALLFDKEKNILSIPIWEQEQIYQDSNKPYIEPRMWRGFYIFGISPVDGIALKGKVEHSNNVNYDYSYGSRSFYIGDVLYTVTSNMIKMNDLNDIHEINQLKLHDNTKIIKYID